MSDWIGDDADILCPHEECAKAIKQGENLIHEALRTLVDTPCSNEEHGHLMPTRFVLVAEYADKDGERWLRMRTPEGMEWWDVAGILSWAQAML